MATQISGSSQIQSGSIVTDRLAAGILSADSTGRALFASSFFDASTVSAKFASAAITAAKIDLSGTFNFTGTLQSSGTTVATQAYVDATTTGLSWKQYARVATAAALPANTYANGTAGVGATITVTATGTLTVDGVLTALNDRILVKDEGTASHNGLYVVTTAGATGVQAVLTRTTDANTPSSLLVAAVFMSEGTANADKAYVQTATSITIGTTSLTWVLFSSTTSSAPVAGDGITVSGTTVTARADTTSSVQSIVVNSGASPAGIAVKFDAAGAIDATSSGTRVKVSTTGSIQISSNALAIKLDSNPGLQSLSSGLSILLDTNPGLKLGSGGLSAKVDGTGAITSGASGLAVNTDGSTIELSANAIRIKDLGVTFAKLAVTGVTERLGRYDRLEQYTGSSASTQDFGFSDVDGGVTDSAGLLVHKNGVLLSIAAGDYGFTSGGGSGGIGQLTGLTRTSSDRLTILYKRTGSAI
jgi:hypothetical protein